MSRTAEAGKACGGGRWVWAELANPFLCVGPLSQVLSSITYFNHCLIVLLYVLQPDLLPFSQLHPLLLGEVHGYVLESVFSLGKGKY